MKVRVLYNTDGKVAIVYPCAAAIRGNRTIEDLLNEATPADVEYDDLDESVLPQAPSSRKAWRGSKGVGVFVDQGELTKQREADANEQKIQAKIRWMAITQLKVDGELPSDYPEM